MEEPTALILALVQPRLLQGSVHVALRCAESQCAQMRERRALCLRLLARLRRLWTRELQSAPTPAALTRTLPALGAFGQLLVRFTDTLRQYAIEDATFRLLLSRQLLVKLQRLRDDIDAIAVLLARERGRAPQRCSALERLQWAADVRVHMLLDKQRSGYANAVQTELLRIRTARVALADLRDALGRDGRRSTGVLLEVDGTDSQLVASKWTAASKSDDADDQTPLPACGADAEERDGRLVVRSFSACHLCAPVTLAFSEAASSLSLQTFVEPRAAELATLFYDVALSVHAPHESELASEAAGGDDVLAICTSAVDSLVLSDDAAVERSFLVPRPR